MEINFELTNVHQALLLLVKSGEEDLLKKSKIKDDCINELLNDNLIQYKPNTSEEYMLTIRGEECLVKKILIKYPLHKGKVGNYNDIVSTMSDNAINALVCTMMNEEVFNKLPKKTARVLGQHMLDTHFYKLWGRVLINKWLNECKESIAHLNKLDEKYRNKSSNKSK